LDEFINQQKGREILKDSWN